MAEWIYLIIGIISSVAIWPISKWGLKENGDESALGFANTFIITIASLIYLLIIKSDFFVYPIIVSAVITGLSYGIGFICIMMYCLKIGPSGLTMTINNSAMLFAILYSDIFLRPHVPSIPVILGIVGVLTAIALIGISKNDNSENNYNYSKWYKLVIIGGLLSGVSFSNQAYMGYVHPGLENTMIFMFWANLVTSIQLFLMSIYKKQTLLRKREIIAGSGNAFFNLMGMIFIFIAIGIYGSEVTFPITICVPIVIMLFVGRFAYKEKFNKYSLTGAIMAVISILLISVGS